MRFLQSSIAIKEGGEAPYVIIRTEEWAGFRLVEADNEAEARAKAERGHREVLGFLPNERAARQREKEKFIALFHHLAIPTLRIPTWA